MKKFKVALVGLLLLLFVGASSAAVVDFAYSSGLFTSSTVIIKYPVLLTDLSVYTDGTNNVTVTLYDSSTASTSGTVIGQLVVAGASLEGGLHIPVPVKAKNGIYAVVTTNGTASAIVCWSPQ